MTNSKNIIYTFSDILEIIFNEDQIIDNKNFGEISKKQ